MTAITPRSDACSRMRPGAREEWKRWGPYLSERQWGTVREDYSPTGMSGRIFPRPRAQPGNIGWGEDGLLGFAIANAACALPWRCGTGAIRSSKSGCSDCPAGRQSWRRRSRNAISISIRPPTHSYLRRCTLRRRNSLTTPGRGNRRRHAQGARVESPTREFSTTADTFDVVVNMQRIRRDDIPHPPDGDEHGRNRRRCIFCRRFGFATAGHGDACTKAATPSVASCNHASIG